MRDMPAILCWYTVAPTIGRVFLEGGRLYRIEIELTFADILEARGQPVLLDVLQFWIRSMGIL